MQYRETIENSFKYKEEYLSDIEKLIEKRQKEQEFCKDDKYIEKLVNDIM